MHGETVTIEHSGASFVTYQIAWFSTEENWTFLMAAFGEEGLERNPFQHRPKFSGQEKRNYWSIF